MDALDLIPARKYDPRRYPQLRRVTDPPEGKGMAELKYLVSSRAAKLVELQPEVILHHRLYDVNSPGWQIYEREAGHGCAMQTV